MPDSWRKSPRSSPDNGIDMRAISIAETADYGVLRLIVDQPQKATSILLERGFILSMTPVTGGGRAGSARRTCAGAAAGCGGQH